MCCLLPLQSEEVLTILVASESKVLPCSHEGNERIERRTAEEEFADAWLEVEERFFCFQTPTDSHAFFNTV